MQEENLYKTKVTPTIQKHIICFNLWSITWFYQNWNYTHLWVLAFLFGSTSLCPVNVMLSVRYLSVHVSGLKFQCIESISVTLDSIWSVLFEEKLIYISCVETMDL